MWTFTGYSSEPLLSCVAAILLHKTRNSLEYALTVLNSKVDDGMVEIGQSGELASRLLLFLAKDLFVRKITSKGVIQSLNHEGRIEMDAELIDCQKVSVVDFLEYLFGKTFWWELAEASMPTSISRIGCQCQSSNPVRTCCDGRGQSMLRCELPY
jgi:hypothetical protein